MKLLIQIFGSAFLVQIIIENTTAIYPNSWSPVTNNMSWRNPLYRSSDYDYEPDQDVFFRNIRSQNPARMLTIDLSRLTPGSTDAPFRARHKSPMNLLDIDISVLSRHPDPKIPIVPSAFKLPGSRKFIMADNFDPRYDRLPVIRSKPVPYRFPESYNTPRNGLVYPFQHLPLNVVTTYHSLMENKKEEEANIGGDTEFDRDEKERKYTADFILHLLYHLSSNTQKGIYG